jgi:hypothetical protein
VRFLSVISVRSDPRTAEIRLHQSAEATPLTTEPGRTSDHLTVMVPRWLRKGHYW